MCSLGPGPGHARDTTDSLIGDLAECMGGEVEVGESAPYASIGYSDCHTLALVCKGMYKYVDRMTVSQMAYNERSPSSRREGSGSG